MCFISDLGSTNKTRLVPNSPGAEAYVLTANIKVRLR